MSTALGKGEERELTDLSRKHRLTVFSVSVPRSPQDDLSTSLERLAHSTGGASFFVPSSQEPSSSDRLGTYVGLVDALREVQARTNGGGGPYLVRYFFKKKIEKIFFSEFNGESGWFVLEFWAAQCLEIGFRCLEECGGHMSLAAAREYLITAWEKEGS